MRLELSLKESSVSVVRHHLLSLTFKMFFSDTKRSTAAKFAAVQKVAHQIEKDEDSFQFEATVSPPTIAAVLKLYLRQLPNPLFPFSIAE